MPGVAPRRATEIVSALLEGRLAAANLDGLPVLAKANVLAAAMTAGGPEDGDGVKDRVLELAALFDGVDAQRVQSAINEDRAVAGMPEVSDSDAMTDALGERRAYYRTVIKAALDQLPSRRLVDLTAAIVSSATEAGSRHAPALIED